MKGIIEGLLYVQGDLGLTIDQVSDVLEIDKEEAKELILSLKQDYIDQDRGLRINYLGNSFKLTTKEEHKEYFKKLFDLWNTFDVFDKFLYNSFLWYQRNR